MSASLLQRFEAKYVIDPETDCWKWQAQQHRGYGRFRYPGGQLAHRFAYEHFVGPIPEGMTIDHLCRNRACVNPLHLEAVTNRENVWRGALARTQTCVNGHRYDRIKYRSNGQRRRVCSTCERDYFHRRYLAEKAAGIR